MRILKTIPAGEIERVQIYIAGCRETLAEVKRKTGADYVINGGLYDMASGKPVCHLKADGYVYAADPYTYWGYGWSGGALPELVSEYSGLDNYICCNCLVRGGQAAKLYYNADQGGARARTAMGIMPDGALVLYCSTDGQTPEGLQREMLALGVNSALMLDGGGSVQCDMAGEVISSSRKVHNFLCVKVRKQEMKIYRVQVSAFAVKENAERLKAELQSKGYDAFVTESGGDSDSDSGDGKEGDRAMQITEPNYSWNGELERRTSTKYLILHHAAASGISAEDIHRVHQNKANDPFIGIGYNYYIRKDGTIYRGRPEDCIGAHTYDYNDISIGVCFEGNFETDTMSGAQYNAGVALLRDILSRYPDLLIRGHRDFDATACPGRNFPMEPMKEDAKEKGTYGENLGDIAMTYEQFKGLMAQYEQEQRDEPVSAYAAQAWEKAKEKGLMDGTMPRRPLLREQYAVLLDRMGELD